MASANTNVVVDSLKPMTKADFTVLLTIVTILALGFANRYQAEQLFRYPF
ncbi:hypothetical protein ACQKPX_17490 [Photobacterium sp. DNB23_23_1]